MSSIEQKVVNLVVERPPSPRLKAYERRQFALLWIGGGLLFLAGTYTLYFARPFLLPVALTMLLAGILRPAVERLERWGVPRSLGAGGVVLATLMGMGMAVYYLAGPAVEWVQRAPQAIIRIERKLRAVKAPLVEISRATDEVTRLTQGKTSEISAAPASSFDLLSVTQSVAVEIATTLILLYFLLASGDFFIRGFLQVIPRPDLRQRAVRCVTEIKRLTSVYLVTVTGINFCLGAAASFVLWLVGLPNPVLWGVLLGVLTYIPYLGPIVAHFVIAAVAFVTLDDVVLAAAAPLACVLLSVVEGQLVTPVVLGRSLSLNPVVIFLALMFWTWLWGIPGAVMAVPILMIIKIVCDSVQALAPVGKLLGSYHAPA